MADPAAPIATSSAMNATVRPGRETPKGVAPSRSPVMADPAAPIANLVGHERHSETSEGNPEGCEGDSGGDGVG